jgi:hypothetical protein
VPETGRVELAGGGEIAFRAIDAEDDVFILDTADGMLPGVRATALVARCLGRGDAAAGELTVGDREAILLHLRRMSFGDSIDCVIRCPDPACADELQATITVGDLLVPGAERSKSGSVTTAIGGKTFEVWFRLPTAADLDATAALASVDPAATARMLLGRCITRAECDGAPIEPGDLPEPIGVAVAAAMAERDPQAELQIAMRCPRCGVEFTSLFDAATFLLRELDLRAARTLRDVHTLAQHYHWSESEILRMPARRRARYIELIQESSRPRRTR